MSEIPEPIPPKAADPQSPPLAISMGQDTRLREEDDDRRSRRSKWPAPLRQGWPRTEGVLPREKVRLACFVVLTLALVVAGTLCILAVWGAAPTDVAWKAVTSLAILAGMMAGFTVLNDIFGKRVEPDNT
ncbi:MAG: hypothetical protein WHU94_13640 [Thermogemmata sp.]|mgnify:CR=1 FL=1|jgi:hypothetical protein